MLTFFSGPKPKSVAAIMAETSNETIGRSSNVKILDQEEQFVIKEAPLHKRIAGFFTRKPVSTLFVMMQFKTLTNGNRRHFVTITTPASSSTSSAKLAEV